MPAAAGVLPETDCDVFFENKKEERRWNNDFRELGVPGPSEHFRVMYGGAKRSVCGWSAPLVRVANMPYLLKQRERDRNHEKSAEKANRGITCAFGAGA